MPRKIVQTGSSLADLPTAMQTLPQGLINVEVTDKATAAAATTVQTAVGKAEEKGDLYARVETQLPTQLTDEEREHYEALRRLSGGGATKNSAA